jgi:pimeloyl-ACP methyl ester carboxylesterase
MGAHASVDAAAARPEAFERLLLVDPVILDPDEYTSAGWNTSVESGEPHPTAKRKNRFPSVEAMVDRFKERPPYSSFHPDALQSYCEFGLVPALESLAAATERETALAVELDLEPEADPGSVQRAALYRAAQEAITNTRKHAMASRVELHLWQQGDAVYLEVTDDGVGLRGDAGLGLTTTRERLESIDGGLDVYPGPGGGTVFRAWVPKGTPG